MLREQNPSCVSAFKSPKLAKVHGDRGGLIIVTHLQKSIQTCSRISFTFLSVLVDKTRIDDFYELENVLEENIEATFDAWCVMQSV